MRFYIFFLIGLFSTAQAQANDTLFVKLDFMQACNQTISVEVRPKFETIDKPTILYIKTLSGAEKIEYKSTKIDANTKIAKEGKNAWWIKDFNKFKSISYDITLPTEQKHTHTTPALIKLSSQDFYFAQLIACVPFVNTHQNYVVALQLAYPNNLYCPLASPHQTIYYDSQFHASEQAVIIGNFEKHSFDIGNNQTVNLLYYTDYEAIKMSYLQKNLPHFLSNLNSYIAPILPANNQLILCVFNNAAEAKHSFWGGFVNANYSLITLPAVKSVSQFTEMLYEILAHEFLHTLTPFNLFTDKTFQSVRADDLYSKHLWLYEGVVEYLSWKFLLTKKYIPERSFEDHFGKKIAQGKHEKISLQQLSEHIGQYKNTQKSTLFYSRGAVLALLLDIEINQKWEGEKDLLSVILELILTPTTYNDDTFIAAFERAAGASVGTFLRKAIAQNQLEDINPILQKIDWEYVEQSNEFVATYGVFDIKPNYKKPYFTLVNVGRNELGFENGDELHKINGIELTLKNGEQMLNALKYPSLEDTITVAIFRKKNLQQLQGQAGKMLAPFYHVIRQTPQTSPQAQQLKAWLFE